MPQPTPRRNVPGALRKRHSSGRVPHRGEESGSDKGILSLPVMSLAKLPPPPHGSQLLPLAVPGQHRSLHLSPGDVSLTDVILFMRELEGFVPGMTTSDGNTCNDGSGKGTGC